MDIRFTEKSSMNNGKTYDINIMKSMIETIEKYPNIRISDLARIMKVSRPTVYRYKKLLEDMAKQQEDVIKSKISRIVESPVSMLHTIIKRFMGLKI